MLNDLIRAMEQAIWELKCWPEKKVQIFHHNDADGLCSGAILTRAFERQGFTVQRFCLEKPYPIVLKQIFEQDGCILIFTDFAGRIAPLLSELNKGRNLTIILDHHAAEPAADPRVHNLDPELYGLKGDRDISASTTCYLFTRAMDESNRDMAHIAALGAVGDGFFVDGRLVSQNQEAAAEAARQGLVEVREQDTGSEYFLKSSKGNISCIELGDYLDILGGVGYFQNGPEMGVSVCLEGVSTESDEMVADLKKIRAKAFNDQIRRLKTGDLKITPNIQWFHVENRFLPMGVKTIGVFCEFIRETEYIDPHKYIAGFQVIPDEIPNFGKIPFNQVKISMRVCSYLEKQIRAGSAMGLNILLPEATNRLGGFSDACHSLTAATTVDIGEEGQLIEEMENILKGDLDG